MQSTMLSRRCQRRCASRLRCACVCASCLLILRMMFCITPCCRLQSMHVTILALLPPYACSPTSVSYASALPLFIYAISAREPRWCHALRFAYATLIFTRCRCRLEMSSTAANVAGELAAEPPPRARLCHFWVAAPVAHCWARGKTFGCRAPTAMPVTAGAHEPLPRLHLVYAPAPPSRAYAHAEVFPDFVCFHGSVAGPCPRHWLSCGSPDWYWHPHGLFRYSFRHYVTLVIPLSCQLIKSQGH